MPVVDISRKAFFILSDENDPACQWMPSTYNNVASRESLLSSVTPWAIHAASGLPRASFDIRQHPSVDLGIPPDATLDPYQYESLSYILSSDDTLLGDDAGLGKTIIMAVAMNALRARNILIICPAVVKYNWYTELAKWSTLVRKHGRAIVHIVEGNNLDGLLEAKDSGLPIITIINYDLLARHKEVLDGFSWDLLVADESHRLKNAKAGRTKAVLGSLGEKGKVVSSIPARKRIFASATALNRPRDLWTMVRTCIRPELCDMRAPGCIPELRFFSTYSSFAFRYCDAKENEFGGGLIDTGASNLVELGTLMRKYFYVRHDDSVLNLPPYVETTLAVALTQKVEDLQDEMLLDVLLKSIAQREGKTVEEISGDTDVVEGLRAAISLHLDAAKAVSVADSTIKNALVVDGGTLFDQVAGMRAISASFEKLSLYRKMVGLDKVPAITAAVELAFDEEPLEPVLLFCHHKEVIEAVRDKLEKYKRDDGSKLRIAIIDGSVSAKRRDDIKVAFQAGEYDLLIANLFAGGEGLTLTVSKHVIFGETDWNATTIRQCLKRIHRRTQVRACRVQFIIMDKTLDVYVVNKFLSKRYTINVVNNEALEDLTPYENLSSEDAERE